MDRDVTITASLAERVGDETYELWLKEGSAAWALHSTGAVEQSASTQDFELANLEEGVECRMQLRMERESRYRDDYQSADPDAWPSQSLLVFTPGVEEYAAPTLNSMLWSRTSGSSERVTVNATSSTGNEGLALQLLRNGTVVDEVAGPHVGAVYLVDIDPPGETTQSYTVRHRSGFLAGLQSAPVNRWVGPDAPTGFGEVAPGSWYDYEVEWDAPPSGAVTRVQDTWVDSGVFAERAATAADATSYDPGFGQLEKNSAADPNGNIPAAARVRIRHELEQFSVTDVSEYAAPVWISTEIASDEDAWDPTNVAP